MEKKYIKIVSSEEIRNSRVNTKFRHVKLSDCDNDTKKVDYIIYEKRHGKMWKSILDNQIDKVCFYGKIISLKITKELIEKVNDSHKPIRNVIGQEIDIVLLDNENIEEAFRNQLWKILDYKELHKRRKSSDVKDFDYYQETTSSYERDRDYFDVMTDGMLGDFDDFKGSIEDIEIWAGL